MRHSKTKKSLLAVATSLLPTAATLLVRGQLYEGIILSGMATALFVAYDYLDDKAKGEPRLPAGVDEDTFEDAAEAAGQIVRDEVVQRQDE